MMPGDYRVLGRTVLGLVELVMNDDFVVVRKIERSRNFEVSRVDLCVCDDESRCRVFLGRKRGRIVH